MYKILLVEDDEIISKSIMQHLENWDFEVITARDFKNITNEFTECNAHIVVLDLILPFYDGFYWCKEIRKISNVPIVFLSSASDNMNIVMAVNMGGDDFIVKPFDLEVLSAKVQAVLRRTYAFQNQISSVLSCGGAVLNLADMSLSFEGRRLELSKNEFRILQILFEHAGNTVTRGSIMKRLWDDECFVDDNTLTVNVNRLRRVLEEAGLVNFIQTKKGVGYQINRRQDR